ncbi:MAG: V-type ATP synthase subunit D [Candidatus Verstraetearchaeota archaeon]|nr:V-type ATP synthase subunit D [Candidatus Verstraetearchaeota archaeon]
MSLEIPSATKGALQRVKEQYRFIQKSKEILEMKRDRLAGEINASLPKMHERKKIEQEIMEIYEEYKRLLMAYGSEELSSYSKAIGKLEVKFLVRSLMGVPEPDIKIISDLKFQNISDPALQSFCIRFYKLFKKLLNLALVETRVEKLALELMDTNRKVNALEKIVVPQFQELIRYMEERIMEDELQEFVRIKYIVTKVEKK